MLTKMASRRFPSEVQADIDKLRAQISRLQQEVKSLEVEYHEVTELTALFVAEITVKSDGTIKRSVYRPVVKSGKFSVYVGSSDGSEYIEVPACPTDNMLHEESVFDEIKSVSVQVFVSIDAAEQCAKHYQPAAEQN